MLTKKEIEAIAARANKATRGPWRLVEYGWSTSKSYDWSGRIESPRNERLPYAGAASFHAIRRKADAEFITHSRTDIPKLLAEIKRLDKLVKKLAERR